MKISKLSNFLIIIVIGSLSLSLIVIYAQLKPTVVTSPGCGDVSGYGLDLNVNGFKSNSNVGWNVVHPETNTVATFGYFSTNSTGGFNETAFVEGDLPEGTYEVHVFDILMRMVL